MKKKEDYGYEEDAVVGTPGEAEEVSIVKDMPMDIKSRQRAHTAKVAEGGK